MATINQVLANNPHKDAFNAIITYLVAENNPFKNALVGNALYTALVNWGRAGQLFLEPPPFPAKVDGRASSIVNANYQIDPKIGQRVIRDASINLRAGDPLSPEIQSFIYYLNQLNTGAANAWYDYNFAYNVFYELVDPITYFLTEYNNGADSELFLSVLGLYNRPNAALNGVATVKGEDGFNTSTAAINTIFTDTVNAGDIQDYWWMYAQPDKRYIFYIRVGGAGDPPVVQPVPNVTDAYQAVELNEAMDDLATAVGVKAAIDATAAFGSTTLNGASVQSVNNYIGSVPASDFSDLLDENAWDGNFVDGNDGVEGVESFVLSYEGVKASELNARYFGLYDESGNLYHFYYNVQGEADTPPGMGAFKEIRITVRPTDSKFNVQLVTDGAINTEAPFVLSYVSGYLSYFSLVASGNVQDPENGTVGGYDGADVNLVSAEDASVIDNIQVDDYLGWQNSNNTLRTVYDSTFNKEIYVESIYKNDYFGLILSSARHSIYRFSAYNLEVSALQYNLPGTNAVLAKKERCRDC